MGSKRLISVVITGIAAVAALTCGVMLSACSESKILATPTNLQIVDDYLTWDEVASAKSYVVEVNGEEYETETNSLDVLEITNEPKKYKFSVLALGDYDKTYDSDFSEEIEYEVNEPKNLTVKDTGNGTYEVMAIFAEEPRYEMTGKLIIPEVYSDGKLITSISPNGFRQCKNITSVYIPDSIDTIGEYAFTYCTSMTRIRLPNSIDKIDEGTFGACSASKEIEIPKTVTEIGTYAFSQCTALENITLNEGLKTIDSEAFSNCVSLKSLILPNSIESITSLMIYGCDSLQTLEIAQGGNDIYKSEGNCIIKKEDNSLVLGCVGSIIPDSVTSIGANAFKGCAISEILIPEGVTELGIDVFAGCKRLESVSFPSTLQYLPNRNSIFQYCGNVKSITVDEKNPFFKSDGNCIIRKSDNVLVMGCAASVIPEYIKVIGDCAFHGCFGVYDDIIRKETEGKNLVIPNGVTEIGEAAFANCNLLKSVSIPESVVKIGREAFAGCYSTSIVIPSSVQIIGSAAFGGCCVFTSYKFGELPQGWKDFNSLSHWYTSCKISYGCKYGYDEAYPFVESISKGYGCTVAYVSVGYRESVTPIPYRIGYTFLGWAEEENSNQVKYATNRYNFEFEGVDGMLQPKTYTIEGFVATDDYDGASYLYALYAVWQKN